MGAGRDMWGVPPVMIVSYALFTLYSLCVCGYSFVWYRRFRARRDHFGFVGRKRHLIFLFAVSVLIWTLSRVSGALFTLFGFYDVRARFAFSLATVNTIVTSASFAAAGLCFCLRVWLIYFDCSLAAADSDDKWKCQITAPVIYFPDIVGRVDDVNLDTLPPAAAPSAVKSWRARRSSGSRSVRSSRNSGGLPGLSALWDSQQITVHGLNESDNWWVRHKNTMGNRRWLMKWLLWMVVPFLLVSIVLYVGEWFAVGRVLYLFVIVVIACFPAWIAYRFPHYNDAIHMVNEMKLGLIIGAVVIIVFTVSVVIELVIRADFVADNQASDREWDRQRRIKFWHWIAANTVFIYGVMVFLLVQTKWVCLIFPSAMILPKEESEDDPKGDVDDQDHSDVLVEPPSSVSVSTFWTLFCFGPEPECLQNNEPLTPSSPGSEDFSTHQRLATLSASVANPPAPDSFAPLEVRDVIADDAGFRHFMDHLFQEFSFESLLCIVEVTQFAERFSNVNRSHGWSVSSVDSTTDVLQSMKSGVSARALTKIRSLSSALTPNRTRRAGSTVDSAGEMDADHPGLHLNKQHSGSESRALRAGAVVLPESVRNVRSSIVYHNSLSKEQIFCVLCEKYILLGSQMPVNISMKVRSKLTSIHDFLRRGLLPRIVETDEELDELKTEICVDGSVFAPLIRELMKMLRDSLGRFRKKREYAELKKRFAVKNQRNRNRKRTVSKAESNAD